MAKRLYRSRTDSKVFGVLGGLGEYWETDPTIVRLAFVLLFFVTAVVPLLLAYVVAAMIVPLKSEG